LLRLLARLALFRIAALRTRGNAGLIEETQHAVGRLRAMAEPMTHALFIDLHALAILRQHWIPGADLLDETAVARRARIGDHNVVIRALLRARPGQSDFQ